MDIVEVATCLEGTDTQYYSKAKDYWGGVTPTIDGMLGGFAKVSCYWPVPGHVAAAY